MNLKERLIHLAHVSGIDRQMGRTTLIARAAKEIGGMIIARDFNSAQYIEREHGVTARSMDLNLMGFSGPVLFDHYAVEQMFLRAAHKIGDLEIEIKERDKLLTVDTETITLLKRDIEQRELQRKRDAESMAVLSEEIGRLQKLVK